MDALTYTIAAGLVLTVFGGFGTWFMLKNDCEPLMVYPLAAAIIGSVMFVSGLVRLFFGP